jgi:hypothetical protein
VGICEDTDRLNLDYKILTNSNFYLHISVEKFGYFCVLECFVLVLKCYEDLCTEIRG